MSAHEIAANLCVRAEKLGLDAPTEDMIADAINNAIENARDEMESVLTSYLLHDAAETLKRHRKRLMLDQQEG